MKFIVHNDIIKVIFIYHTIMQSKKHTSKHSTYVNDDSDDVPPNQPNQPNQPNNVQVQREELIS